MSEVVVPNVRRGLIVILALSVLAGVATYRCVMRLAEAPAVDGA